jgi:hypothetical protein
MYSTINVKGTASQAKTERLHLVTHSRVQTSYPLLMPYQVCHTEVYCIQNWQEVMALTQSSFPLPIQSAGKLHCYLDQHFNVGVQMKTILLTGQFHAFFQTINTNLYRIALFYPAVMYPYVHPPLPPPPPPLSAPHTLASDFLRLSDSITDSVMFVLANPRMCY